MTEKSFDGFIRYLSPSGDGTAGHSWRTSCVDTLPIVAGETAVQIAKRAKQQATLGGYDVYMLDTAGRLQIDATLMQEVEDVRDAVSPRETLLVVDV